MRILVTGSRHWDDEERMRGFFEAFAARFPGAHVLVHGEAEGADKMAARIARELGWEIEPHPADWKKYKRGAGPIRNSEMVALGADVCVGFPTPMSIGTYDCMEKARKAGIRVLDIGEKVWDGTAS